MTKILCWNLDGFDQKKIEGDGRANDVLAHIVDHVVQCAPDIFVVVGVQTTGKVGSLASGDGYQGLQILRAALNKTKLQFWSLVPPLITGSDETVGVFFRTGHQFTGPDLWPGGYGPGGPDTKNSGAYPKDYGTALPDVPVAATSLYNPNKSQQLCAARVQYNGKAKVAGKPAPRIKFATKTRAPHLTTFWDTTGQRNIRIFSVHGPANNKSARTYMTKLAAVPDIIQTAATTQISVVVGDFNVNLLAADGTYASKNYGPLLNAAGAGYTLALQPPDSAAVKTRGYYATHIAETDTARCSQDAAGDNVTYPAYAYATAKNDAVDNAFYAGVADAKISIINAVVGSPYTLYPDLDPKAPKGTATFTSSIAWPNEAGVTTSPAPPENAYDLSVWKGAETWFQEWRNYRKARAASDHLPLLIEF